MQIATLYHTLVYRLKVATNFDMASPPVPYRANESGRNMIACAKIMGITPAALTFRGIYCLTPPYCLLPTILLAY